jgi:hypothetical protein
VPDHAHQYFDGLVNINNTGVIELPVYVAPASAIVTTGYSYGERDSSTWRTSKGALESGNTSYSGSQINRPISISCKFYIRY